MLRFIFIAVLFPVLAFAEQNVVLITFDGVRRAEFFNKKALPIFWQKYAAEGVNFDALVANGERISMPGYQNITTGAVQPCDSNDCGRVHAETIFEGLLKKGFAREQVAGRLRHGGLHAGPARECGWARGQV